MSMRSTQNKRTQERLSGEARGGMTRRSAGRAKPAQEAAGSVRVVPASSKAKRKALDRGEDLSGLSKEERRARRAEERRRSDQIYTASNILVKQDPDYAPRRRVWWGLVVSGMVSLGVSWLLMFILDPDRKSSMMQGGGIVFLVLAYGLIFGAFIYDHFKINKLRKEARRKAGGMGDVKLAQLIERDYAARDKAKAEKKAARGKGPTAPEPEPESEPKPQAKRRRHRPDRKRR